MAKNFLTQASEGAHAEAGPQCQSADEAAESKVGAGHPVLRIYDAKGLDLSGPAPTVR
jgi:hypothetical protein